MRRILAEVEAVTILERVVACRDPTDNVFLELAVNAQSDMNVTGNLDLLSFDPFRGIPIVDVAAFTQGLGGE